MPIQTLYVEKAPAVAPGADGLIHIGPGCGLPPRTMTRGVALALARSVLSAIAVLEDREASPRVVQLHPRGEPTDHQAASSCGATAG